MPPKRKIENLPSTSSMEENEATTRAALLAEEVTDLTRTIQSWRKELRKDHSSQQDTIKDALLELNGNFKGLSESLTNVLGLLRTEREKIPAGNTDQSLLSDGPTAEPPREITICVTQPSDEASANTSTDESSSRINQTEATPLLSNPTSVAPVIYASEKLLSHLPTKPKFADASHPVRFLESLERYFRRLAISNEHQLDIALDCLGNTTLNWVDVYKGDWNTYEDFRRDFLHHYWSITEQNGLRHRICTDKWDGRRRSMVDHVSYFVSQSKLLIDKLPERILVSELIQHFPHHIQSLWQASDKTTIPELVEFLRKQSLTSETPNTRRGNQINTQRTNNPAIRAVAQVEGPRHSPFRTTPYNGRYSQGQVNKDRTPRPGLPNWSTTGNKNNLYRLANYPQPLLSPRNQASTPRHGSCGNHLTGNEQLRN